MIEIDETQWEQLVLLMSACQEAVIEFAPFHVAEPLLADLQAWFNNIDTNQIEFELDDDNSELTTSEDDDE